MTLATNVKGSVGLSFIWSQHAGSSSSSLIWKPFIHKPSGSSHESCTSHKNLYQLYPNISCFPCIHIFQKMYDIVSWSSYWQTSTKKNHRRVAFWASLSSSSSPSRRKRLVSQSSFVKEFLGELPWIKTKHVKGCDDSLECHWLWDCYPFLIRIRR